MPRRVVTALELAMILGGLTDRGWLAGGKPPGHAYWARVWAARALRYVWAESAAPAVVGALGDEHWRVRELAAKVVGDRELGEAAEHLVALLGDDTPRVASPPWALGRGEGEHGAAITALHPIRPTWRRRRGQPSARAPRPRLKPFWGRSESGSDANLPQKAD